MVNFATFEKASKSVRSRLGIARLSRDQIVEVKAMVARHIERQANPRPEPKSTGRIAEMALQRIREHVDPMVRRLYRGSHSSWAGGETTVNVNLSPNPSAWGRSDRAWSHNNKWTGTNARLSIHIAPNWLSAVLAVPGLADAGGMLTTHVEMIDADTWRASWVRQGRGFELISDSGYIVRDGSEYAHAKTINAARRILAERKTATHRLATADDVSTLSVDELIDSYGDTQITISDSIRAGNCRPGTRHWIERYYPGRKHGTIREVLTVDTSEPARRACAYAIARVSVHA